MGEKPDADKPADINKLTHELQTQQIEPPGQVDESLPSEHEQEVTRDHYSQLQEWAPAVYAALTEQGVIVTDANKIIRRVNQGFTQMTGYSPDELIGQNPALLRSGLHDKVFYQAMWDEVKIKGFWQGEVLDKRKNGEVFPALLAITGITDLQGQIQQYVGSFTDLTGQKLAEKVLLESRRHFEKQITSSKNESMAYENALNVVIKQQKKQLSDVQLELCGNLRQTVMPFLDKLKNSDLKQHQVQLLKIIEANLLELITACEEAKGPPPSVYRKLTPCEIQVASMVRQGLSSKAIASLLSVSVATINSHRKHIRKKLGLDKNVANLCTYLTGLNK
jgi:PAS domain S-box-containing protein